MIESPVQRANDILKNSELICSADQVEEAIQKVADGLNATFATPDNKIFPLFLGVMGGAVIFTGQLLPKLNFPLEFDFIHVSRYGNDDHGSEIIWKVIPRQSVMNRVVVVLDDILDEGETLFQIKEKLLDMGAAKVILAVLVDKDNGVNKPVKPDHIGLMVPNRFVIGCGMDYAGFWRNLGEIRALPANTTA